MTETHPQTTMSIKFARRPARLWRACAELVRCKYASAFGADVDPSPDAFLAASAVAGSELRACVGITFTSDRPFFSERYFDQPIDELIARQFGRRPSRARIVEVGSLASATSGAGSELVRYTPMFVWCLGMQYILCTATAGLQSSFRRLQIPFTPLQAAERGRLESFEQVRWGDYYEAGPCAGVIPLRDLASLFSSTTGRYSFFDPDVTLLPEDYRLPEMAEAEQDQSAAS